MAAVQCGDSDGASGAAIDTNWYMLLIQRKTSHVCIVLVMTFVEQDSKHLFVSSHLRFQSCLSNRGGICGPASLGSLGGHSMVIRYPWTRGWKRLF